MTNNPAVHAINFALSTDQGLEYLYAWREGDFDACRSEWPEAPELCYLGAEPQGTSGQGVDTPDTEHSEGAAVLTRRLKAIGQLLEQLHMRPQIIHQVRNELKALIVQTSPDPEHDLHVAEQRASLALVRETYQILRESRDLAREYRKELEAIMTLKGGAGDQRAS